MEFRNTIDRSFEVFGVRYDAASKLTEPLNHTMVIENTPEANYMECSNTFLVYHRSIGDYL